MYIVVNCENQRKSRGVQFSWISYVKISNCTMYNIVIACVTSIAKIKPREMVTKDCLCDVRSGIGGPELDLRLGHSQKGNLSSEKKDNFAGTNI
jgi:hypothetical protein